MRKPELARRCLDLKERRFKPKERSNSSHRVALPFAGHSSQFYPTREEFIPEDSFFDQAINVLGSSLGHLTNIHQLELLSLIHSAPLCDQYFTPFTETRALHSDTTAFVIKILLTANGFSPQEIKTGIVAGLLHDRKTVPMGDALKRLDPQGLDEQKHWQKSLEGEALSFLRAHQISLSELDEMINDQGVLGQALDISDRIAYVCQDLEAAGIEPESLSVLESLLPLPPDSYEKEISVLLGQHPRLGNIINYVAFDKEAQSFYFTSPRTLGAFLELRALLFKNLYLNPINQGRGFAFRQAVKPFYVPQETNDPNLLCPDHLFQMADEDLGSFLVNQYGILLSKNLSLYHEFVRWYPEVEKFATKEEAEKRRSQLLDNSDILIIGIDTVKGYNPSTSYLVRNEKGQLVPYAEYNPQHSAKIKKIMDANTGVFLYYDDLTIDKPKSVRMLLTKALQLQNKE